MCYSATWQFIYHRITPDFLEKYAEYAMEKERAAGATEHVLAEKQRQMARYAEMYRNTFLNVAITFAEPLPVGLVMTLISATLLRTRRRRVAAGKPEFG